MFSIVSDLQEFTMENLYYDENNEKNISLQNPSHLKRASTEKLREIFNRYATKDINGEKFMTSEDFVRKFLGLFPDTDFNDVSFLTFTTISLQNM